MTPERHLMEGGWLKARPRIGIEVATLPEARAGDRLKQEIEQLIVAAQRGGIVASFRTKKPAANYNAWTGVFPQSFLNSIDSPQPKNEDRLAG